MRRALLPAVLAALLLAPAASAWTWPATGSVLQPFLFDPAHPYAAGQHRGIDVGAAAGSTVLAPASGTVTFAGSVPSSGKSVTVETPDGYSVTLTHLGSINVGKGSAVVEGAPVGTVGPSGDAELAEPYVHLGVRLTAQEQGYLDPLSLLPPRAAAPPSDPAPAPGPTPAPASTPAQAVVPVATATLDPAPAPAPASSPASGAATAAPVEVDASPAPPARVVAPRRATVASVPAPTARLEVAPAGKSELHSAARPVVATSAPQRPAARSAAASPRAAAVATTPERVGARSRGSRSAAELPVRLLDPSSHRAAVHDHPAAHEPERPSLLQPRPSAVRATRPTPAAPTSAPSRSFPAVSPVGFLLALPFVLAVAALTAGRRRGVPIIASDALLRDHADLLRQRQTAHRARVHDDRGRHSRAAPSAARRRDLLSHRRRRARDEGLAGR